MQLTVKNLKGEKFQVETDESNTIAAVKEIIEKARPELPAAAVKLIHSGRILKDTDTIAGCGIKASDFLVAMVSKPKKPAAAAAPAATPAAPAAAAMTPAAPAKATAGEAPPAAAAPAAVTAMTPAAASTSNSSTPAAPAAAPTATTATTSSEPNVPAEAVNNLVSMGFPEAEVRHCLRMAQGNPDVAVEFLTNGIPEGVTAAAAAASTSQQQQTQSSGSRQPLQALRNHPQFNDLRRLVQSNPQMLQQVLTQIGQQQPELLQEINNNQALFLEMMNEPITNAPSSSTSTTSATGSSSSSAPPMGGMLPEGLGNPAQMAQMIQNMSPEELNQMAQMMGLSPDQLRTTAQMIGSMPPEQLNQFMMQAMGGGGGPGAMLGGGGPQVLRLSEDEMAAVDRLADMGFDRAEAAQAFLACDKNEALAANLLMDSMGDAGGFFGGGGGGGSNNDDNNPGNNGDGGNNDDDDEGDDMYD